VLCLLQKVVLGSFCFVRLVALRLWRTSQNVALAFWVSVSKCFQKQCVLQPPAQLWGAAGLEQLVQGRPDSAARARSFWYDLWQWFWIVTAVALAATAQVLRASRVDAPLTSVVRIRGKFKKNKKKW
jgi:hypothetical protein